MITFKSLRFLVLAVSLAAAPACAVDDTGTEDELTETEAEAGVRPSFDIWENSAGNFYFHMQAGNGEIILASQGYDAQLGAITGLLSVLDNGGLPSNYTVKQGVDGKYYVSLQAGNGLTIATGQGYSTKSNANRGVDTIVRNIGSFLANWDAAKGARLQVNTGNTGKYSFNLHAKNGAIVLSSESYTTEAAAFNGAMSVLANGDIASRFEMRVATNGKHYFVLKAGNGEIIGNSQMYSSKQAAQTGRDAVITLVASGSVVLF